MESRNKIVIVLIISLLALALAASLLISRPEREVVPPAEEPEQKEEVTKVKPKKAVTFEDIFGESELEEAAQEERIEVISEEEKRYMERVKNQEVIEED